MKEYGGYIELDKYNLPMLHDKAIALNCGRNCLAYLIRAKRIKKILIPYFLCDSVQKVCEKENVQIRYYHIDKSFEPISLDLDEDEWLYLVNFYNQLSVNKIQDYKLKYERVIVDNAQAYFNVPTQNTDTLYTCRKFFGVADGAFLYTDSILNLDIETDESFNRMRFLLGRFERTASEFYLDYADNNVFFETEPIKKMSKLTDNLLHALDYKEIAEKRTENFKTYHNAFANINELELTIPYGAFMYPLYIRNGAEIRKALQKKKIYIPTLWSDVFDVCNKTDLEYDMAENILPLPVDQRYGKEDIDYITNTIINQRKE